MRSLFVARWAPWPPASGAQLRSAAVVAALAGLGDVDVFLLADPRHSPDVAHAAVTRLVDAAVAGSSSRDT